MAEKKLRSVEIFRGENGGHRVVHSFERTPAKRGTDVYMERPTDEEHNFGPGAQQQHAIMTHIAKALGFSQVAKAEGAEDRAMAEENAG